MPLLARVEKSIGDAEKVGHFDTELTARTAVATMVNWLGDLPDEVIENAARAAHLPVSTCHKLWPHLLAQIRQEAGLT
jgi:hypothetical protein